MLTGKSLEVLWEVLSRVLWEIGGAPRGDPEGAQGTRECLSKCSKGALSVDAPTLTGALSSPVSTLGITPRSTPNFPEHPQEHFPEYFQGFPVRTPVHGPRYCKAMVHLVFWRSVVGTPVLSSILEDCVAKRLDLFTRGKLPSSDLKFAGDFWVDFFLLFSSKAKGPRRSTKKDPR